MGQSYLCRGIGCDNHPQVCVDWCDAYAYCLGVGKHLCGKIGGGANQYYDYANPARSQWYRVCSSAGVNGYPYGNTYVPQACNSQDYWGSTNYTTLAVGSLEGCQAAAPYGGAYDLSGSVGEWEDSCDGTWGLQDFCAVRGGDFTESGSSLSCGQRGQRTRLMYEAWLGFRCCLY